MNERCPNCGHTGRTHWDDTGETTCHACGHVIGTTYELAYDPDRTPNFGKPGRQLFNRAELRWFSLSTRWTRLQNQQEERIPMVQLVEKQIEASPFPKVTKDKASQVCRCIPAEFFSVSRLDTSHSSFGIDDNPTADQRNARREHRALCFAWAVLALVDRTQPIGWRSIAEINGVEVEKCLRLAEGIDKQLCYEDAEDNQTRVTVADILELPRPTFQNLLDMELERLLIFLSNEHKLPHSHKMSLRNRAWDVLDSDEWGISNPLPSVEPLAGKSAGQLGEMAVSIALLDFGYPRAIVHAMHEAFPRGRMVKIRKDILSGKFTPWPSMNLASVDDDFSSLGGERSD